jgi:hypothetical protein
MSYARRIFSLMAMVNKNTDKRLKINDPFLLVYLFSGDCGNDCTPEWRPTANNSKSINNNIQEILFTYTRAVLILAGIGD